MQKLPRTNVSNLVHSATVNLRVFKSIRDSNRSKDPASVLPALGQPATSKRKTKTKKRRQWKCLSNKSPRHQVQGFRVGFPPPAFATEKGGSTDSGSYIAGSRKFPRRHQFGRDIVWEELDLGDEALNYGHARGDGVIGKQNTFQYDAGAAEARHNFLWTSSWATDREARNTDGAHSRSTQCGAELIGTITIEKSTRKDFRRSDGPRLSQ